LDILASAGYLVIEAPEEKKDEKTKAILEFVPQFEG
jgi:hypothetical protein